MSLDNEILQSNEMVDNFVSNKLIPCEDLYAQKLFGVNNHKYITRRNKYQPKGHNGMTEKSSFVSYLNKIY